MQPANGNTTAVERKALTEEQMLQIGQMCERNIHYRRLLYDDRLLDPVEDLVGPNIQLFHDQALYKPAHHGGPVHWHQDNAYWKCSPPNLVSCWLTLLDTPRTGNRELKGLQTMQNTNGNSKPAQRKALSEEQINSFWTNGYLKVGKILEDDEIELLRREYDGEFERARNGHHPRFRSHEIGETRVLQIMQMCEYNIHFRRLLYNNRILDLIEDLIGPNIQLFHDQALFKPARHGGPAHWHQDNAYWRCSPPNLVSCWLTLDDVDVHNSAMQFLPGTHFRSVEHGRLAENNALLELGEEIDESKAVVVPLPAGGMTLHHCQTLHHTAPNKTDRQRRAFAIHFMTPGTRSLREMKYLEVSFEQPVLRMRV